MRFEVSLAITIAYDVYAVCAFFAIEVIARELIVRIIF